MVLNMVPQRKTAAVKKWKEINDKIFKNVASYVMGNKFNNKYTIDCSFRKTHRKKIIYPGGYGYPVVTVYFGSAVSIAVDWARLTTGKFKDYWQFSGCDFEVPEDEDLYIRTATEFLRCYLEHASRMAFLVEEWPNIAYTEELGAIGGVVNGAEDCPNNLTDALSTQENILRHEWTDKDDIEYMIGLFKSKAFRRSRGDCK